MKKILSVVVAIAMLLSLVAPFRMPAASAAVTAITVTDTTKTLSWFSSVPGFGVAGTKTSTTGLNVYLMGDIIHGTFTTGAIGPHTLYLIDSTGAIVDQVTVNVPAVNTPYAFTLGTANVTKDGIYFVSADNVVGAGDVAVYVKYNIVTTTPTLQTCVGTSTVSGWITRGNGQTVTVPVNVFVTYPDLTLAGQYVVPAGSSGQFTITFPSDEDGDGTAEIGTFYVFASDGYDPAFDPDNDAIIYASFSNVPSTSLSLKSYITPFLYKGVSNQPLLLVLTDQNGNYVTGATFAVTNATVVSSDEISKGFYRFELNVGNVVDVRFTATYNPYGTPLTANLIVNTRDLGVYNPYIDIQTPDAIAPYGEGPWTLDSVESVYDKLPCTIGNSFEILVDYYAPADPVNWQIADFSYDITGPVEIYTGTLEGFDKVLVTKAGKISVSMSFTAWQRANKDPNCPISAWNACCDTFEKTVDICEVASCTYGGVTLTGDNTVDSKTVQVGKKVDKVSVSIDPTGAPADLTCSCPNYVVLMYMVNSNGAIVPKAFTVDTWAGVSATGSVIWYNPQGVTGPNIPDQPVQTFLPSGIYTANNLASQVSTALKFTDCPFGLQGITFNYPTDTDCGYTLVVKVFGLRRVFNACGQMLVSYPMIAEEFDPITVLPAVTKLTSTGTIWEGAMDPDQILAGIGTVIDITDPKFSTGAGSTCVWQDIQWKFYLNGKKITGPTATATDTGYRFSNICLDKAGTFKIYGYRYNCDCTKMEEVTLEFEVVAPEFKVELGLLDGSKIENDNILTEGFFEDVYVTVTDPRGVHDFTNDTWSLLAGVAANDCGLYPAKVTQKDVPGQCCGRGGISVIGLDNPCVEDDPMVDLYFVSPCGAQIYIDSFKLVPPTIKVDPAEVPFTIPATTTHVTFTVTDAHGHGAPGVSVVVSGVGGFGAGSSGYTWNATAGTTGDKGEVDWGFVPPFSGQYVISADVSQLPSEFKPCGWDGVSTSAILKAVYKAPVVDTTAPTVTVTAPEEVKTSTVKITGKATDNVGVVAVWIGAKQASLAPDGTFEAVLELVAGDNTFTVSAYDAANNVGTKSVTIKYVVPQVTKIVLKIGSDIMMVNDKAVQLDAAAEIKNGRTFLPLRAIAEAFGAEVTWVPETQGITVVLGDTQIGLQIGNNTAVVNGNVISIEPPYIKNSRTMVPFRVISEAFGADVQWDPINYIVTVTLQG
jgi:hypothetical protein